MPVRFGDTLADRLYYGDAEVARAYAGDDLVYDRDALAGLRLLDLVDGAAAAYSLRRLSTAYEGPLVRVRRSSDSAEADIGFADEGLDTAALLAFCGAGSGFVRTWYDQSGSARHGHQTTPSAQPRVVNAGTAEVSSGLSAIRFRGTDVLVTAPTAVPLRSRLLAVVYAEVARVQNGGILSVAPTTGNDFNQVDSMAYTSGDGRAYRWVGSTSLSYDLLGPAETSPVARRMLVETKAPGSGAVYLNGALSALDSSFTEFDVTSGGGPLVIGGRFQSGTVLTGSRMNGSMQEIIYFGADVSAQRDIVEADVNAAWTLY